MAYFLLFKLRGKSRFPPKKSFITSTAGPLSRVQVPPSTVWYGVGPQQVGHPDHGEVKELGQDVQG